MNLKRKTDVGKYAVFVALSVVLMLFGLNACGLALEPNYKKGTLPSQLPSMQVLNTLDIESVSGQQTTPADTETPTLSPTLNASQLASLTPEPSITPPPTPNPVFSTADIENYSVWQVNQEDENASLLSLREIPKTLIPLPDDYKQNALLKNFLAFIQILNQIRQTNNDIWLDELKNTDWHLEYQKLTDHSNTDFAQTIDTFRIANAENNVTQVINDAVGLSALYATMDFEGISSQQAQRVCEIIADPTLENKADLLHENKVQFSWFFKSGDYQVGDIAILPGENCGMGLVVGKSDEQLLLVVPDLLKDGQLQSILVDERSIDAVFGEMKYVFPGKKDHSAGSVVAGSMDIFKPGVTTIVNADRYENIQLPFDTMSDRGLFDNNIVITIDDCYNNQHVRAIFELLKNNGLRATFFPNTNYLLFDEETISLWQEIYQAGFEIGYHTTNHATHLSYAELEEDFWAFTQHMRALLEDDSFEINLVRAPYGVWYENWYLWSANNGLMSVDWNVLTEHQPERAELRLQEGISPIVLLHSTAFDVEWLNTNLNQLIMLARQYDGIVGSVYDCVHRE